MRPDFPRVLVLTGTARQPFARLVRAAAGLVAAGAAREVRVQCREPLEAAPGVVPLGILPPADLDREVDAAEVVVTHGGSGSCFAAVRAGFRPVVVPRRAALGEHVDDHQRDVAAELARRGLATALDETDAAALARALAEAVRASPPRRGAAGAGPARAVGARLRALAERARPRRAHREGFRVERVDRDRYRAFFRTCPYAHPLQATAWGEARRLDGWVPSRWLALGARGEALAGAQALSRAGKPWLPRYLPYGPVAAASPRGDRAATALLRSLARRSASGLVWAPYPTPDGVRGAAPGAYALKAPSTTGFVPLDDDATLLERARPTWRREAERGLRDADLSVRIEAPVPFVPDVLRSVHALARERGFSAPIRSEVGAAFAASAALDGVDLACVAVEREGRRSNAYVVACVGAWALTLWTAQEGPDASGAGRVALLAAMREARGRGCRSYDVSGVDDAGNEGVARFKRGLRPDLRPVPGLAWIPPAWLPRGPAAAVARRIAQALGGDDAGRLRPPSGAERA